MVGGIMEESILKYVRQASGLGIDDTSFDTDLMTYINSALGSITQQGAGNPMVIVNGEDVKWSDFLDDEAQYNSPIRTMTIEFVVIQVRILFDPPPPGTQTYMEYKLRENEWRIQTEVLIIEKGEDVDVGR